jgi:DNA-directed RNA polymerase I subunit RPA1
MGPTDANGRCATCSLTGVHCPGHFGHIDLPLPVYNPLIFSALMRLLRHTCLHCFHLKMARTEVRRCSFCSSSFCCPAACSCRC